MNYRLLFILIILASVCGAAYGRKVKTRLPAAKGGVTETVMVKGSQAISTMCATDAEGYSLADVVFSGYDKKNNSTKESFFVVNKSDRVLTGITLRIIYLTTDSVQLHSRLENINCDVAPGERCKIDIRSWDTQKSFHYYLSDAPHKKRSTPYIVYFDPITIYLRYKD